MRKSLIQFIDVLSDVPPGVFVVVGIVLFFGFMLHSADQTALKADKAAQPYLEATDYNPPDGCPMTWDGSRDFPYACAPNRYRISSQTFRNRYGLNKSSGRSTGWYRVGDYALHMNCNLQPCRVLDSKPNVFGH